MVVAKLPESPVAIVPARPVGRGEADHVQQDANDGQNEDRLDERGRRVEASHTRARVN